VLTRHRLGLAGESLAAVALAKQGYEVLERRFACRRGDIDLVCRKGTTVFLVEVKTRASAAFGTGPAVITPAQRRNLAACAAEYRSMTRWKGSIRLLLASVRLGYDGEEGTVEVLADAIA